MPWYRQVTSWIGLGMIATAIGLFLDGRATHKDLLYGIVSGAGFIVLQGAQLKSQIEQTRTESDEQARMEKAEKTGTRGPNGDTEAV